jgi:hypothetical protein
MVPEKKSPSTGEMEGGMEGRRWQSCGKRDAANESVSPPFSRLPLCPFFFFFDGAAATLRFSPRNMTTLLGPASSVDVMPALSNITVLARSGAVTET